ncbi:MAG: hypothetical protein ACFFG0_37965 [Candidatus Thorarchaeota archaeon]
MAAAVMLTSAYGAVCVTYNLLTGMPSPPFPPNHRWQMMFPYVGQYSATYVSMNLLTWIFSFVYGIVIYGFLTKRKWAHWLAVATAAVGFISGLIPAILSDTRGFTQKFTAIGSPHWARTLVNLVVLGILALILIIPATRKGLISFTARGGIESSLSGNTAKQLMLMSGFFFWLAAFSFLASGFMRNAHVIDGINVWQTVQIQYFGGLITAITGATMLTGGFILHQIRPSPTIVTTS